MASVVVCIPYLRPALPHHLAELFWNAASFEDSHWNEAARTANLSADWMEFPIGHHCRQTDALEEPDFVFELHEAHVSREARLLQHYCLLTTLVSVMLNPFASLRVSSAKHPGIFPHCLSLHMRGFFASLRMTGGGVFLYQ
jgi:hypothetical protein